MRFIVSMVVLACTLAVSGCLATGGSGIFDLVNELNESSAEMMGIFQAPTLASSPQPSGCGHRDQRCLILDQTEANLYQMARSKTISWRQLVEQFYSERARQYPNTNDSSGASEIFLYQRVLADQMDRRQISETQWAYLIDHKSQEIYSRSQQNASNAANVRRQQQPQAPVAPKNCWTTRNGDSYYTTCN